ncbi:HEAT repeat domain-containing protein [Thermoanaerobacter sp. YS13]|uniref:HEAT repeat domain-containing protein n=1 Tax=Thermoanaerobacter sp. YS13 TaxID=1511746 RepID=UPI0009F67F7D|nr:HEAT repeat domain-containing protein [Thermoanaerobacter sp. YS13]
MMRYICPMCFKIAEIGEEKCSNCGYDFKNISDDDYSEKLIKAINHPDYNVAYMAAKIIGELKIKKAEKVLIEHLRNNGGKKDPYIEQIIVWALGEIGGEESHRFLLENKDKFSVLTKNIIENSLEKIKTRVANKEGESIGK